MKIERDEQGSIILMMLVMMVASGLVLATIVVVERGLRTSRRSGDSANALQVADAAINDAMQAIPTASGTSFTRSAVLGEETWPGSCPVGKDCYTFTATRDPGQRPVWHIDAVGTDKTGVKRRIRATAVATSLFSTPLYVKSTMDVSSGVSLDSFNSGISTAAMCTKKGIIATSTPSGMTFGTSGQGGGVTNCQAKLLNNGWTYSMDGCTSYGDGTQDLPPMGTAKCPPEPQTFRTDTDFSPPDVVAPTSQCVGGEVHGTCYDYTGSSMVCGAPAPGVTHTSLEGGKTYYYTTIALRDGCRIPNPVLKSGSVDLEKPVVLYASSVSIGRQSGGSGQRINQPPTGSAATTTCGATATSTLLDGENSPSNFYCPLWSGGLRIRVLDGALGTVTLRGSGTMFWGAIENPAGTISLESPQIKVWGAAVSNIASSAAQFTWHFDDNLRAVTTTQFELHNWREEPISQGP